MKRTILTLALAALAGSPALAQRVTLNFWTNGTSAEQAFFETLMQDFEKANPNIDVRVQAIGTPQYLNAVQLAFRSGNQPDVLRAQGNFFNLALPLAKWVEQGWLLPIDRYVTPAVTTRYPQGAVVNSLTTVDGKRYSLPMQRPGTSGLAVLVYNKKMFQEAGLTRAPRSWAELRSYAKRLTDTGKGRYYGLGLETGDPRVTFLAARGGFVGDHTGALDYTTGRYNAEHPAMAAAVEVLRQMNLTDRSLVPGWEANYDLPAGFGRGQIAMMLAKPAQVAALVNDFKLGLNDFGLAPVPSSTAGTTTKLPYEPALGFLGITARTKYPNEAWKLLDYLYSADVAQKVLRANQGQLGGFIPAVRLSQRQISAANPVAAPLNAVFDVEGVLRPDPLLRNPDWSAVQAAFVAPQPSLIDIQKAAIQGQGNYADLAARYDAAYNAALDKAIAAARGEGARVCRELLIFPNYTARQSFTLADYRGLPGCQ